MSSIQELREETYKVIHETEQGGNSASRIGNLYNGIIDFLGLLDDRTADPYYYDDTALKEAIRRVDAAIVELDRALDAALVLVNQERQRLDDLVNSIDGEITEKVDDMLNDAEWLQQHAQGIQEMVNEGEIEWKSEWNQNVEAYLQEVGVWAREGDVIKTQWTEIVQSVDEISSTVAEVQTDLAGRPTATQWTQITQKVNGIEQSVNALLYEGETTEALQSSINQSIDDKVASLNLETTYAKIDTEDSKEVIEWMYSAFRNETTSEKTFNDIVSAGKSGLMNGVSNIHTYVEVVRNGEVLDYVAGSAIEAKVNDAVTGLYNKASAGDVQTTIFSQVKKDTSDIAAIVTHATGDYTSASIATKFDRWKTGLALKTDIDSASASLIATMDEKDNAAALTLTQTMNESMAAMTTRFDNKLTGFIAYADFEGAFVTMIAQDQDYGSVAQIFASANESGSEIKLSADKITMTDAFANSITANTAFIGYLTGGSATFKGKIQATSGYFTGELRAATGTFSGSLSAASGTFDSGTLKNCDIDGTLNVGNGSKKIKINASSNTGAKIEGYDGNTKVLSLGFDTYGGSSVRAGLDLGMSYLTEDDGQFYYSSSAALNTIEYNIRGTSSDFVLYNAIDGVGATKLKLSVSNGKTLITATDYGGTNHTWPTSSSAVGVGGVYVDNGYLKVKTS